MKIQDISSKPVKVRLAAGELSIRERTARLTRGHLSDELRTKYGVNSVRIRPGDSVKLVRGEYAGVEGKVQKVFPKEGRITIEGVTREKIAGGTTPIHIHSSGVIVTGLNLDDKFRRLKIEGSS